MPCDPLLEQVLRYDQFALIQLLQLGILLMASLPNLEREARQARARELMRELGRGLGEGRAPHDAARHHDTYLYSRKAG